MNLQDFLTEKIQPGEKTAIMGVGSVLRSDDGAGSYFIERLTAEIQSDDLLLISGSTAPENFTGVIKSFAPKRLFIVDAAHMELPAGEIRILETAKIGGMSFSTHMLPLPIMLKYLELETGCEVICIGIQPKSTEQGFSMCEEVRSGAERLANMFYKALTAAKRK
jgi:hydrogenase 3 maturation protease